MDTTPDALREAAAGTVLPSEAHAPELPSEDDDDAPASDYAEEQAEFDLAADFELGLTEEDPTDPPSGPPDGNGNGKKAGKRGRVDAA
jgi:hypothetical protein